ncbi:hypothetical protein OG21DRAFT_1415534, partial [Imleria badia]
LAYIHSFKPFNLLDESIQMLQVSHSMCNHQLNAAVIPVSRIVQPYHLVPRFPNSTMDPLWIRNHPTLMGNTFYLNHYIKLCMFQQYSKHVTQG